MILLYQYQVFGEMDPSNIKWGDAGAEYVVESTGAFTGIDTAGKHMAGEQRVVLSGSTLLHRALLYI